ncbi:MAG: OmpH family outer membrane protein [Bacteroidales bacterium]|nr:OmpH family outer membrane protein [Bacteroidales bacterium]
MKAFKTLILTAALMCGVMMTANAQLIGGGQKIVYVDSEYIMENIPEYGDAQEALNALSSKWQNEVKAVYDKVSEMYSKYQTEMLLLSEDQKRAREQAIVDKEQEAKNLQMQYFGSEGQLYQKRTELIQPIQEKVYTAMKEVAQTKNYAFVLDLASGTSVLYANDKNDISDEVLDQLGNVMQTVRREDRRKANSGTMGTTSGGSGTKGMGGTTGGSKGNTTGGSKGNTIKPKK